MIWFDFLALGFIVYYLVRGFLSGFIKNLFSFVGMIVAFLYSGWLSLKLKPYVAYLLSHPTAQILISFLAAFLILYFTFVLFGFLVHFMIKTLDLSLGDRILGALLGFLKGALFATFLYYLIVIPFPASTSQLEKAMTYPIVSTTSHILGRFIPQSWVDFIKKTRKYYELPKTLLN